MDGLKRLLNHKVDVIYNNNEELRCVTLKEIDKMGILVIGEFKDEKVAHYVQHTAYTTVIAYQNNQDTGGILQAFRAKQGNVTVFD